LELHVFNASEIRVKKIELNLPVAAHLGLGAVEAFAVVTGEGLDYVTHVGGAEREVVEDAKLFGRGIGAGFEHVLEPISTIGYLYADPIGLALVHTAVPVGTEAKEILVEAVLGSSVADHKAGVDDAVRGSVR
jgi:hypothetical protein